MKNPYIIIGGGIIGSTLAREIRKRDLADVVVLEKEKELAMHTSGRNSGVIHSGINQKPGTLKAKLCVEGNRIIRDYCRDNKLPYEQCGTLVIARNEEESSVLEKLLAIGTANGAGGLRIIGKKELEGKEPFVRGYKALYSPTGAIVDSRALVRKVAEEAESLGAEYKLDCEVLEITNNGVITNKGEFNGYVINCAGLYADKIAHMCGNGKNLLIIPFKGNYVEVNVQINSMVYQVPDLRYPFLGVHLTKSVEGKVLGGPTATLSLRGRESYDGEFNFKEFFDTIMSKNFWNMAKSKEFLKLALNNGKISIFKNAFLEELNSILKIEVGECDIKPYRAGIRAQIVDINGNMADDFILEKSYNSLHILNAISPGLTSSFAFVRYIADNYIKGH